MAPRSAGTASKSRSRTRSKSSFRGRWTTSSLAALLRIASTRFCRWQLRGIDGGLGVDVGELAHGEDARALGLAVSSSPSSVQKVRLCSPRVITSPSRSRTLVLDGLAVQQGAVLALEVEDEVPVALLQDLRVVAGEPLVGQEDVALPRAADGHAVLDEREALLGPVRGLDGDLGHGPMAARRDKSSTGAPGCDGGSGTTPGCPCPGSWSASARLAVDVLVLHG